MPDIKLYDYLKPPNMPEGCISRFGSSPTRRKAACSPPERDMDMPQIFVNGVRIGGLAGLQAALKQMGV